MGGEGWAAAAQGVIGIGGTALNWASAHNINQDNWRRHREELQNQLQWRVADAKAAGIHPLAALGLSPASGPVAQLPDLSSGMNQLGQAVSDYIERNSPMSKLREENAKLQNQILSSEAEQRRMDLEDRKRNTGTISGGQDIFQNNMGQAPSQGVQIVPSQVTSKLPQNPVVSAGVDASHKWSTWPVEDDKYKMGEMVLIPQGQLADLVSESAFYAIRDWSQHIKRKWNILGKWNKKQIKELFSKLPPIKKGWEYVINPNTGSLYVYKLKPGEKDVFIDPRIGDVLKKNISDYRKNKAIERSKKRWREQTRSKGGFNRVMVDKMRRTLNE